MGKIDNSENCLDGIRRLPSAGAQLSVLVKARIVRAECTPSSLCMSQTASDSFLHWLHPILVYN